MEGRQRTIQDLAASLDHMERALVDNPPKASDYDNLLAYRRLVNDEIEVMGSAFLAVPMDELHLTAMVERPALIERYLDICVERNILSYRVQAELGFRILNGGGDLAGTTGPVYSPELFRKIVMPRYKRKVEEAHRLGLKYVFRSDGNLWPISEHLFKDIGCDAYGEIDVDAGMDLWKLHERFPDLVLWGGLSCGRLLRLGAPDAVLAQARKLLETIGAVGKLTIGSSNTIMPGTPAENVLAIRDALGS